MVFFGRTCARLASSTLGCTIASCSCSRTRSSSREIRSFAYSRTLLRWRGHVATLSPCKRVRAAVIPRSVSALRMRRDVERIVAAMSTGWSDLDHERLGDAAVHALAADMKIRSGFRPVTFSKSFETGYMPQ